MLIDTHAHLNFKDFKDDYNTAVKQAFESGVKKIINVGSDLETSKKAVELAEKYENLYATIGIHPIHTGEVKKIGLNKIITQLKSNFGSRKIVAVGETGLDYFRTKGKEKISKEVKNSQKELFFTLLNLAGELDLPVIIHSRDSAIHTLEVLKKARLKIPNLRGVMHCFSYDLKVAKKVLDLGFLISFTGNITYKNSDDLRKVVEFVPIDRIMLETDCPFLSPELHRGERNEPAYVVEVAKKIAEIKNISLDVVEEKTSENAIELFNLQS